MKNNTKIYIIISIIALSIIIFLFINNSIQNNSEKAPTTRTQEEQRELDKTNREIDSYLDQIENDIESTNLEEDFVEIEEF